MEMRFEYIDNVLIAHVQCYLDQMGAENFKYVLAERMKEGEKVVLDLEKLVNIDNFGLDALLAVAQKETGELIGDTGINPVDGKENEVEIGYVICKKHSKKVFGGVKNQALFSILFDLNLNTTNKI